ASLAQAGYLVLSDTHYPGWQVDVDGQRGRLHRANLLFRAVYLPPGSHTVEFQFQPQSLRLGAAVSILTVLLAVPGLLALKRDATRHP
ncbi:MAG: YfhO family protein, partial [Anaerolineae bacterium]